MFDHYYFADIFIYHYATSIQRPEIEWSFIYVYPFLRV